MSVFDDPGHFGRLWADTYDLPGGVPDPAPAVEFLAQLAGNGPALELAIGTGRVALPLAERGITVEGVEASPEMVAKLRAKPGGDDIPVAIGDMAEQAGLRLTERYADWDRSPFGPDSTSHVSVYRLG
ncbi:class I SAM-dependent methyltransferase [Verrucosispora sp. WMMD573]|uniref:methyltransferase domain-containing protein n=1 Tax=Verrucosispora sp. WMMD573 TaxID=3015149 RepID=UPI00248B613E|nr:class I SAM-dependent methyltransferase [Verrucosispora sp. WMMD573]WBB54986.1 class I SAM-dependent methyltransferase [Verrucosispora sp. WMMD573]